MFRDISLLCVSVILASIGGLWASGMLSSEVRGETRYIVSLNEARVLHAAASSFGNRHPGECPNFERLQQESYIRSEDFNRDPWGRPYAIVCAGEEIRVVSAGADRLLGTRDDVQVN